MKTQFIDHNSGEPKVYNSLLVAANKLNIFGSELVMKIIKELAKEPACAMDLARNLNQHEQKIYYHLRRLEEVGVIKKIRTEKRYSMTAKIYGVVSPVISTKLYEDGHSVIKHTPNVNPDLERFFYPFVDKGKLNAKIIVGDSYPHGKYEKPARDAPHAFDLLLMLGNMVTSLQFPHYKLDVDVHEKDLKDNLILIGGPKGNTIVEKFNEHLPVFFNAEKGWEINSKLTGKSYDSRKAGVILKLDNPFTKRKKILLLAGIGTSGTQAVVIGLTRYLDKIFEGLKHDDNVVKIVEGIDKDGDKIIDSIKVLE